MKNLIGKICYIRSLEPYLSNSLSDLMRFVIIGETSNCFIVGNGGKFGSSWKIKKSEVVFEDRVVSTIPIDLKEVIGE